MLEGFEISKEVLQKAKDAFKELTPKWKSGLCYGDRMGMDGTLYGAGHTACHSWASWYSNDPPLLVLNCHPRKRIKCEQESVDAYVLWLSRESPFAKYVLNSDDTESLLQGGMIIACGGKVGATKGEMLWMCKTVRYAIEGSQALDTWKTLVDAGVDPMLAICVASYVSSFVGGKFTPKPVTSHGNVFNDWGGQQFSVVNLLNREYSRATKATSAMFSDPVANTFDGVSKFSGFCKPIKKDDGWGKMVETSAANKEIFAAEVLKWEEEVRTFHKIPKEGMVVQPLVMPTSSTVYLEVDL